ncbi:MAG TPA: hypothetical protein VJW23_19420 [Propionibacteriaceae bacterium]|nr:hypothetical protein [Propionibacteriaceae bacterium]
MTGDFMLWGMPGRLEAVGRFGNLSPHLRTCCLAAIVPSTS